MDLNAIIEQVGNMIYGLQALSAMYGAAVTILVLRRIQAKKFPTNASADAFFNEVLPLVKSKDFEQAAQVCDTPAYWSKAVPQLVLVALENREKPVAKVRQSIGEAFAREVIADLEYRVSSINMVVKSAPMLGLLGTVVGMIAAFGKIATMQKAGSDPSLLANDISLALITTAIGLVIAIPLIVAVTSIQVRIGKLQDSVQQHLGWFLEVFEPVAGKK
jgi:biopolymer transport protein ExbB